jgi:hypothetical protein
MWAIKGSKDLRKEALGPARLLIEVDGCEDEFEAASDVKSPSIYGAKSNDTSSSGTALGVVG